jgi:hypothetical protein
LAHNGSGLAGVELQANIIHHGLADAGRDLLDESFVLGFVKLEQVPAQDDRG